MNLVVLLSSCVVLLRCHGVWFDTSEDRGAVRDIDIAGYNDYFALSLKALKGDPEARREMTLCIACLALS